MALLHIMSMNLLTEVFSSVLPDQGKFTFLLLPGCHLPAVESRLSTFASSWFLAGCSVSGCRCSSSKDYSNLERKSTIQASKVKRKKDKASQILAIPDETSVCSTCEHAHSLHHIELDEETSLTTDFKERPLHHLFVSV